MKKIFALVLIVSAFSACKKDKTTTTSSNNMYMSPYSASTASVYSGAFVAGNYTIVSNDSRITMNSNARASFHSEPQEYKDIGPGVEVGSVKLNGQVVPFETSTKYYEYSNWDINTEQVWEVGGRGSIPSFNVRINNPTPSAADFGTIPDSVSLSHGFTLHVSGVKNVTPGARVIIYDKNYLEVTSKPIVNGDNTITFNSSDFTFSGTDGAILIELENSVGYSFYGKDFLFIKAKGWMKQVKFQP